MGFKVLLDANVCLDFLLRRDNYSVSKQLSEKAIGGEVSAYITPSIFHIIAYFLAKYHPKEQVKAILLNFCSTVAVKEANYEVVISTLTSSMPDVEDALQYYTAINHRLDYFITYDKGLQKQTLAILPILSPQEFLGQFYN